MKGLYLVPKKASGTPRASGTRRAVGNPGVTRTPGIAGTPRTAAPSDGGAAVKSGSRNIKATGGAGTHVQERQDESALEAVLGGSRQTDTLTVEKPPMADPISSGEDPPDETPDKQGRVGKAKGGRPKGASKETKAERDAKEKARSEAEQDTRAKAMAEDLKGVVLLAFGFVSARAGPHWELTEAEADRIAYRVARVDLKYQGLLDKYGEEIMLIGCIAAIGYPRVKEDIRLARERARGKLVEATPVEKPVNMDDMPTC